MIRENLVQKYEKESGSPFFLSKFLLLKRSTRVEWHSVDGILKYVLSGFPEEL